MKIDLETPVTPVSFFPERKHVITVRQVIRMEGKEYRTEIHEIRERP